MDHTLTVGDLFWPVVVIGGLAGLCFAIFGLIWLFNPFRSGH